MLPSSQVSGASVIPLPHRAMFVDSEEMQVVPDRLKPVLQVEQVAVVPVDVQVSQLFMLLEKCCKEWLRSLK